MLYYEERKDLCEVTKMMFDRFNTNAAGGNISVKVSDKHFIMTPTLMSQAKFCRLTPEDILVIDREGNVYEGNGKVTREFNMHCAVFDTIPEAGAVVHAHPKESMVFASLGLDLPHLTEATRKLGEIKTLKFAPATSVELAETVRSYMETRKDTLPVATLLREHGILVVDTTLRKAYDMLERIEYNAYVNIHAKLFQALGIYNPNSVEKEFAYNLEE
ncbi:class II aldolase/adducin family protein [Neobacillus cucumis]|uniref:class II aldolase/adducin family protein n=1 Tax=Neobacillus cucumis TaxID=1740721 RepID=UPI0020423E76|nr:class II aldolase/adducin family protein [Neobacillus cucumis]MCM3726587.1 class II aldolase/adducin family protein [Neobacillus cucumis]